jgi:signal transduction histidine kinase
LTIRTKLAATLAVPLAALAAFAALQVRDAYGTADHVKRQAAVATAAAGPAGVVNALMNERDFETLRTLGLDKQAPWLSVRNSRQAEDATDSSISGFTRLLAEQGRDAAGAYTSALRQLRLKLNGDAGLRAQADDLSRKTSLDNAPRASKLYDGYTDLIANLLDANTQASARIDDARIRTGVELLDSLNRQNDVEARIVMETLLAGISSDPVLALDAQRLAGLESQGNVQLSVRAGEEYAPAINTALNAKARKNALARLNAIATDPIRARRDDVLALPKDLQLLRASVSIVSGQVMDRSVKLAAAAQGDEQVWIAVAIGSLLLAFLLLWLTNRWITRPLRALADQAAAMAGTHLPDAVKQILATPTGETIETPDIAPVKVRAGGEVRDVANALNQVQESALGLAVEQAQLRGNVADAFVSLGRRNQNLLSRQLEFITQLETEESDPKTLGHLFKLDHLATRMRRNAESLLVLAGHEAPRTWSAPVEIGDVVRGALGEVEGYQRVRLRHLDDADVDGSAAVDVSHVVAELVENALAFSPPEADVEIYGRRDEFGYVLTIVDQGIGMGPEDLQRANDLINSADAATFAPSRFLGHYVVAQLAARHNLNVHLSASPAGGLTAMIALPGVLIGIEPPVLDGETELVAEPPAFEASDAPRPLDALPRRDSATPVPALYVDDAPHADAEPEFDAQPWLALLQDRAPEAEPTTEAAPSSNGLAWPTAEESTTPAAPIVFSAPVAPAPEPDLFTPPPLDTRFNESLNESLTHEPWPVAQVEATPEPQPLAGAEPAPDEFAAPVAEDVEPAAPPKRPGIGLGTFADLRSTPTTPRVRTEPALESLDADSVAPVASPDGPAPVADRAGTYAEVSDAVDALQDPLATPTVSAPPGFTDSEDFLPSRLPKRGRKGGKGPWTREKPATPAVPPAPTSFSSPPAPNPYIATDGARIVEPSHAPAASDEDGMHFQAPPPSPDGGSTQDPNATPPAPAEGGRIEFFAAFRDAAERAREEAGIDDRRVGR